MRHANANVAKFLAFLSGNSHGPRRMFDFSFVVDCFLLGAQEVLDRGGFQTVLSVTGRAGDHEGVGNLTSFVFAFESGGSSRVLFFLRLVGHYLRDVQCVRLSVHLCEVILKDRVGDFKIVKF